MIFEFYMSSLLLFYTLDITQKTWPLLSLWNRLYFCGFRLPSAIPYCHWTNREALSTKREKTPWKIFFRSDEGGRGWRAALIMHGDCWWLDCVRPAAQRRGGEQRAGTRSRADSLTPVATFSHALKNRPDCTGPDPQTPQSHITKQNENEIRPHVSCWIIQYKYLI